MADLTQNRIIPTTVQRHVDGYEFVWTYPVEASAVIFEGSFLSMDTATGFVHIVDTTDAQFIGIALEAATGGSASGDVSVRVGVGGISINDVTGATIATPGAATVMDVFVTDDQTLNVAGTLRCGQVVSHVTGTTVGVKFMVPQSAIT